jgi:predicted ABC-type ATPase
LLRDYLQVDEFVNADVIARGLSEFQPDTVAMQAGRIMLQRLDALGRARKDFAFETTLASRTFAERIRALKAAGYSAHLVFLYVHAPEVAIARVAERVRQGGHDIPEDVIRRRFDAGLHNFFKLYQPLCNTWTILDNSDIESCRVIAVGSATEVRSADTNLWCEIQEKYR